MEVELSSIKMLENMMEVPMDAFATRLLYLEEAQLNRYLAIEHYESMQDASMKHVSAKFKRKGIVKGNLVLRYSSKLDKSFQKKFQVKWEGPFQVFECFENGTYQWTDLDGTLHASRVNGLHLKKYIARLLSIIKDDALAIRHDVLPVLTEKEDYGLAMKMHFDDSF